MIKNKLIRRFALGLCMTVLLVGATNVGIAQAQSGGGISSELSKAASSQESILYEKQREMDQYLFIDNVEEITSMGFEVIYTGVAKDYVEVGITPYNEEFAAYIYDKFGMELVKVVDTEKIVFYEDAVENTSNIMPADYEKEAYEVAPIMDMGDAPVSNKVEDEALIKEREQLKADEEEKLTIQIESIDGDEPREEMDPELIWQTGIVEDFPAADISEDASIDDTHIRLVAADGNVKKTVADNAETEEKGLPTASIIAIVASGVIIIGGAVYSSSRRKAVKKN